MKKIPCNTRNYTKGRGGKEIRYIVVHYTANDGDRAVSNGNYFARSVIGASAHYFVDENDVVISVEDHDMAWHCGAKRYKHNKCRNNNSIGVELCCEKDSKQVFYINNETRNNALYLIKTLMKKYNIPVENVIRHYDVTGKNCPAPYVQNSKAWANFKKELVPPKPTSNKPEVDEKFSVLTRTFSYRDKARDCVVVNHKGENYIKVRDIAGLLGESVTYDKYTKETRIGK